ncbi:uncharacterized protein N7459_003762 [Penicillium hispanicum]|uniref:uncharacterized protein n=1 Tax=Penicillium hispanicum TaxID=1080232 RepID=UPI0025406322|nr:uncharacterized protein N7459_003762 [Penicillium hispanicum]KAJ5587997.1 hypothetical protein N7459_003762 [Penicillium hispanicum]
MAPKDKYTDPQLRNEVKQEIHGSDKGGKPGQWSARKAQMMASEYKRRGGSYNTSKEEGQNQSQKHLEQWTNEEWQTKEGSGTARQDDGTRKRYLPKEAWKQMSDEEKADTDKKKTEESMKGKQFVENTPKAKEARKKASRDTAESQSDGARDDVEDDKQKEHDGHRPQTRNQTRSSRRDQDDTKGAVREQSEAGQTDDQGNGFAGTKRSAKQ